MIKNFLNKIKRLPAIFVFLMVLIPVSAGAAMYALNPNSFTLYYIPYVGYGSTPGGFNDEVKQVVNYGSGETIAVGSFTYYTDDKNNVAGRIAKINADGSYDEGFAEGDGFNSTVYAVNVLSSGKVLVGGSFDNYNMDGSAKLALLNSDGSLDTSLNVGSGFNNSVFALDVDSGGKIYAGGDFTNYNGSSTNRIARINADGTIDPTFNVGSGFDGNVTALEVDEDGKVYVGGEFTTYNGETRNYFVRLNSDGSLDNDFNVGLGFSNYVHDIAIDSNDKILVVGAFATYKGNAHKRIVRLNADGSVDNTLVTGEGFDDVARSVGFDSSGKILVGGDFREYNDEDVNRIVRLETNGTLDTSLDMGTGVNGSVMTIAGGTDGQIKAGGTFNSYNNVTVGKYISIAHDTSSPTFVRAYTSETGDAVNIVYSEALDRSLLPDANDFILKINGETVTIGLITTEGTTTLTNLSRSIDREDTVTVAYNVGENKMGDLWGNFVTQGFSTVSVENLSRSTLTYIDTSFVTGTGFNNDVQQTIQDSSGRTIAVGKFTTYKGGAANRIARLNSNGSIDSNFDIGTGFNGDVNAVTLDAEGRILVTGAFSEFDGDEVQKLVRLNEDGSLDDDFKIADKTISSGSQGYAVFVDSLNKIILAGTLTEGGNNYKELKSSGTRYWRGITSSSDGSKLAAVVDNQGYIHTSSDSGESWIRRTTSPQANWTAIDSSSDGTKLVAVNNSSNGVYRSTDSGVTWTSQNVGGNSNWAAVTSSSDGTKLVAANYYSSSIYYSTTSGAVWVQSDSGSSGYNDLTSSSDGTKVYASRSGQIFRSTNSGATWITATTSPNASWETITTSADGNTVYAMSVCSNAVYKSTDAGVTWTASPLGQSLCTGDMDISTSADGNIVILAASYYPLFYSKDAGVTWIRDNDFPYRNWLGVTVTSDGTKAAIAPYYSNIHTYTFVDRTDVNNIARFNENGSLDTSFMSNVGSGFNGAVRTINLDSNGKIYAGGEFTVFNGSSTPKLARLNTDGTYDSTFEVGTGFSDSTDQYNPLINKISFINSTSSTTSINHILVGGKYDTYKNASTNNLSLLNEDGSLDSSFAIGFTPNGAIRTIATTTDGKILIGGEFNGTTTTNGTTTANYLARLNSDGSLDTTFDLGTGFTGWVNSITVDSSNKAMVAGTFRKYNGTDAGRIIKLLPEMVRAALPENNGTANPPASTPKKSSGRRSGGGGSSDNYQNQNNPPANIPVDVPTAPPSPTNAYIPPPVFVPGCQPGYVFSSITGELCAMMAPTGIETLPSNALSPLPYVFTRDLTIRSVGEDVRQLQRLLNAQGFFVAQTGAGSTGNETTFFGGLTRSALARFQAAKGILPSVGYFGAKTRAFLNSLGQ
jgi:uncharacterized delta-60 repeat protein